LKNGTVTLAQRYRSARPYLLGLYIVLVATGFVYFNMRLTVEWMAAILLIAAVLWGRALLFVRDWGVFFAVLLAWQLASPLATSFNFPWHLQEMIDADKLLFFGQVPAVWLQQHLYYAGTLEPWDVFAAVMYLLHFLAPLVAGFALWITNRDLFRKFAITFVIVALAGFATYILYPAVPPWMAAFRLVQVHGQYQSVPWGWFHGVWQQNPAIGKVYLPGVHNLFNDFMHRWYNPYNGQISLGFLHLHYDQVAAIPSEHAMYPLLFFLFLQRQFGKWANLSLIYIAGLLFSITYMGQHYVVDAIIGFAYAGLGYAIVMQFVPFLRGLLRKPPTTVHVAPANVPAHALTLTEMEEA
jgi:hypothetical protein